MLGKTLPAFSAESSVELTARELGGSWSRTGGVGARDMTRDKKGEEGSEGYLSPCRQMPENRDSLLGLPL